MLSCVRVGVCCIKVEIQSKAVFVIVILQAYTDTYSMGQLINGMCIHIRMDQDFVLCNNLCVMSLQRILL